MAAGTRIAPALLRIQQGAIQIKQNIWSAETALKLLPKELNLSIQDEPKKLDPTHLGFDGLVSISDVSFRYPTSNSNAVHNLNLEIPVGNVIAFVGPSGAGKTTVADILLGVIQPDSGGVFISGLNPVDAIRKWPGAIAYVPQDVYICKGDIRTNVALGYPLEDVTNESIYRSLEIADLGNFVDELPDGIYTDISDRGTNLSGGQRQRLGIARALFTRPKLLVLDEATSALDGESESRISSAINSLKGSTTVILIAHRLSTIKEADLVCYLDGGIVRAKGTFEQVRREIPEFDALVRASMDF
jgi:ABC-type multidrug transport system fused ATPase/permease subunit